MLPVKIAGIGSCLPARRVTSAEIERERGLHPGWVERVTGVRERRRADGETTVGLAADAARQALRQAGIEGGVDLIVGASASAMQFIPCTAALVQRELGLPDGGSFCFDVNATCLSFLVGLHTAARAVAAGQARRALVFSSEITAHGLNPDEPESYALMGDAAAAAVLTAADAPDQGIHLAHFTTHASGAELTQCVGGGTRHHPNDPATTREMNFFSMKGPLVYRMAARLLPDFLDDVFGRLGVPREAFDAVVPHQASAMGVRLLTARCGLRDEQIVRNLATRGNCVAASIPLALAEAVQEGRVRRGNRVLLVGSGAGLSFGAVALRY